jgi:hypothetical protein
MVEAAGVEPEISVENAQLTDSGKASFSWNTMISKSSVQITYKDSPELQNFQTSPALAQHAEVLFYIYTSITCRKVSRAIIVGAGLSEVPMPATNELVWTLGIVFFLGASLIRLAKKPFHGQMPSFVGKLALDSGRISSQDHKPAGWKLAYRDEVSSAVFGTVHGLVATVEKFLRRFIRMTLRHSDTDCDLCSVRQASEVRNFCTEPLSDLFRLHRSGIP